MNWAAQDDMKFDIAADVQRNSLERIKLGIPDGDKCDANIWPLIINEPERPLASRGIDPQQPPTALETSHGLRRLHPAAQPLLSALVVA
jgi:hypothetical protein